MARGFVFTGRIAPFPPPASKGKHRPASHIRLKIAQPFMAGFHGPLTHPVPQGRKKKGEARSRFFRPCGTGDVSEPFFPAINGWAIFKPTHGQKSALRVLTTFNRTL